VPDSNPFEDVERAVSEIIAKQLEMVRELDSMEVDVTSWEADFLSDVIDRLEKKKIPLTQGQIDIIHKMCDRYDLEFDL
jgi:hypothetical protein